MCGKLLFTFDPYMMALKFMCLIAIMVLALLGKATKDNQNLILHGVKSIT
jgi:hypothetical protein